MKPKLLLGLAVVCIAAVGAAVAVSTAQRSPSAQTETGQRLFPDLAAHADDVRAIAIARKDGTFQVAREGDQWIVPDKFKYPAEFDKVRKLLVGLSELRAMEAKSTSPSLYPAMEVEDVNAADAKSAQVTLKDGSGHDLLSVIVGKQHFGKGGAAGDGVYVRKAGDAQAWLAQGRLSVDRDVVAWLERKVVDVSRDRVRDVAVKADGHKLVVKRAKPEDSDFAIEDMPADRKVKSAWDVNAVGGAFESLELDDVRPAADLDFSASSPVTEATTFDGLHITAAFVEKDGATWTRFSARFEPPAEPIAPKADAKPEAKDESKGKDAAKPDEAKPNPASKLKPADEVRKEADAINARVGGWAYKLPTYKVETLRKKLDDLLEQKAS